MLHWLQRIIVGFLAFVAVVVLALLLGAWILFGTGQPYDDLTRAPLLPDGSLEAVVTSDRPVGNVVVTPQGRLFYTLHPQGHPQGPKLYEWVDGAAVPFPAGDAQAQLLDTPLGLAVDGRNRLWVIDSGRHGLGQPQLLAFDLDTGAMAHRHAFARDVAPWGSFLQDLAVSSDGQWVYVADAGFFSRRPGLVVYDVNAQRAHRVLSRHETVQPRNLVIRTPIRQMTYFGGFLSLKAGVDGIALSEDDTQLYYAAMNHDSVYRIPVAALKNPNTDRVARAVEIETVGQKPISDGIELGSAVAGDASVYITDVEHQAVMRLSPDGRLETVLKDARIRWADGLSLGPDGWMYLSDSALPHLILRDAAHRAAQAPYTIWRFRLPPPPEAPDPMLPPRFSR